jgi:hypothetical protein
LHLLCFAKDDATAAKFMEKKIGEKKKGGYVEV